MAARAPVYAVDLLLPPLTASRQLAVEGRLTAGLAVVDLASRNPRSLYTAVGNLLIGGIPWALGA